MNLRRSVVLLLLVVLLSGCGFALRGVNDYLLGDRYPDMTLNGVKTDLGFGSELARLLDADGVRVNTGEADDSLPVLAVSALKKSRQVVSVDRDIRAREYALFSEIQFSFSPNPELAATVKKTLRVRRDLVVDPNQVLGSDQEETRLRREMERDLAQAILLRLRLQ